MTLDFEPSTLNSHLIYILIETIMSNIYVKIYYRSECKYKYNVTDCPNKLPDFIQKNLLNFFKIYD